MARILAEAREKAQAEARMVCAHALRVDSADDLWCLKYFEMVSSRDLYESPVYTACVFGPCCAWSPLLRLLNVWLTAKATAPGEEAQQRNRSWAEAVAKSLRSTAAAGRAY